MSISDRIALTLLVYVLFGAALVGAMHHIWRP